ncbi:GRAM domain-containing protein 2B [Oryzias melastigma]|uniref:GRAM domain-containing protein 2B-like n=2 Tax=Oryzias melastigma TaxID=30732 RepID=A0A3B3CJJ7_ORYME|nr:GRAM domain-containing protein 2B [Oryzias melastigma]
MSLKSRKFSLDSSCPYGPAPVGGKRSNSLTSRKSSLKQSFQEAPQEAQELNPSPDPRMPLREMSPTEEVLDRSDGLIRNHSFQKYNKSFHKLFPEIPEEENLTHTFTCALQKEVLYHGKLFVSEHHVCFHSSVLLKDTKVVIPVFSVSEVKKQNSALSMLSIQTSSEKYSFVSLRNREMCYRLLQNVCSHAQESANSSPTPSSTENEGDHDRVSGHYSLDDSLDPDVNSLCLDSIFPDDSSKATCRCSSPHPNSPTDADHRDILWIWRLVEKMTALFLREAKNLSAICYIFITLLLLMVVASGYIGLKITALEEQLNFLGAINDLTSHYTEFKET